MLEAKSQVVAHAKIDNVAFGTGSWRKRTKEIHHQIIGPQKEYSNTPQSMIPSSLKENLHFSPYFLYRVQLRVTNVNRGVMAVIFSSAQISKVVNPTIESGAVEGMTLKS